MVVSLGKYQFKKFNKIYFLDTNLEYFFKDKIFLKKKNIKPQINYIIRSINIIKKKNIIYKKFFFQFYKKNNIEISSSKEVEVLLSTFLYTLLSSIIYKTDKLIYLKKKI